MDLVAIKNTLSDSTKSAQQDLAAQEPTKTAPASPWTKLVVLTLAAGAGLVIYSQFGSELTLASLAEQEAQLRAIQTRHPILIYGIAFLIYVLVTGLSLPGAAILTLLFGWFFGLLGGVLLVSFSSTTGATLAFLLSRFLFRDALQSRFGERLAKFNESLERDGPYFLFTLRLIPAVPFFVINAVMALTPIRDPHVLVGQSTGNVSWNDRLCLRWYERAELKKVG